VKNEIKSNEPLLFQDLRNLIEESRKSVATVVNATLTMLYWDIGKRINKEVLQGERAEYGKQIVAMVSRQLTEEYGKGWSERNIAYMIRFNEAFPDIKILQTLYAKLSWSHFKLIIYMEDPLKRDFYAQMSRLEYWSVRTLQKRIDSMLYERTAISRKPDELIKGELEQLRESDQLTPELIFKDPYFLDFLGLKDRYYEKDLEDAILRELEQFLLELGAGFTFIARQKRLQIDNEDFYIDLLFYNRKLKRLIAVDLKLGSFKAAYKGQMELYLRWLAKHEQEEGEQSPLGIILCAGKQQEQIELLELSQTGIHVAEYLTVLPPLEVLQQKLHKAVESSRKRLENREVPNDL
jgi:predicted nuclease of restriction endonuclease-like (RecB) superfamily